MGTGYSNMVINDETFGEDGHFNVHIKLHEGMGQVERAKLREACRLWVAVWQTKEFRDWLMSFQFQDTSLSNDQIYERLVGHATGVGMVENHAEIGIWTKKLRGKDTFVNTTFEHDGKKWEGSEYLFTYSAAKLAGFFAHEYCRHLDLLHVGNTERSVPFAVGKKTKRMAESLTVDFAEATSAKY
jgi:hypothetical protein